MASIIAGILLLLAIPTGWPYGYYVLLRVVISVIAAVLAWKFYESKLPAWALIFTAIAFLFNPILPIYLAKSSWVAIDFVSATLFFLAAFSAVKREVS